MSKRHQSSRRETYGRRQHEVRERTDRPAPAGGLRPRADRLGTLGAVRPVRASWIRAVRACASRRAIDDGRLPGRPSRDSSALPGRPRIAEGPTLERRRARDARSVPVGDRTDSDSSSTGIVVAFMLAFFWLAQDIRVSATGYDIGRLELVRQRLEAKLQDLQLGPRTASGASRPSASRPSTTASASWTTPRPPGALRSTDMLGRTDSRRRLIGLLLVVRRRRARAHRAAGVLAGGAARLPDRPGRLADVDPRRGARAERGEIYDRTGTVVLASSVARDRLVVSPESR